MGVGDELAAGEGFVLFKGGGIGIEGKEVFCMVFHVAVRRDHKAECAASGIVAAFFGLRLGEFCHDVDDDARGEVLSGTGFFLVCVLFEQSFVEVAQSFFFGGIPIKPIDGLDDFFEVFGFVDVAHGFGVDFFHAAATVFSQSFQQFLIILLECDSFFAFEDVPAIGFGDFVFGAGFFCHFQEEEIGQLGHVLVVGDAVIEKDVAQVPKFGDDFLRGHTALPSSYRYSLISSTMFPSC